MHRSATAGETQDSLRVYFCIVYTVLCARLVINVEAVVFTPQIGDMSHSHYNFPLDLTPTCLFCLCRGVTTIVCREMSPIINVI